jgi:hypothetical protein
MILGFPDTLSGVARVTFDIERFDIAAPQASGRQGGVQVGFPLWVARIEFDRVDPQSADLWRAFLDRLRGRLRRFYCGDEARKRPVAHQYGMLDLARASGGAFDGSAASWSQAITADDDAQITLTDLPAGFQISAGDYIGFKWDAEGAPADSFERRTMVRASLPATADANGLAVVTAEPPLDTLLVPPAAIAHFDDPVCVMQLIPEETQLGPIGRGGAMSSGTIVGIQDLRP